MELFEEKQNKQDYAYQTLKNMIITNELPAETNLVERQLCEMLGLSRTPVRAALQELENNNLVKNYPGRGMIVSKIQLEDYIEIFELRKSLDALSLKLFLEGGHNDIIVLMKHTIADMEAALNNDDLTAFAKCDMAFHEYYFYNTGNKRLVKIMSGLSDQIKRMLNIASDNKERCLHAYELHKNIMDAIENGNVDDALKALNEHLSDSLDYHIKRITKI